MVKESPIITAAKLQGSLVEMLTAKNINDCTLFDDGIVPKMSSLLHISVAKKNVESVKLLLERGIDVNLPNKKGDTALTLALATTAMPQRIIDLLVRAPTAHIDLQNKASATARKAFVARGSAGPVFPVCAARPQDTVNAHLRTRSFPLTSLALPAAVWTRTHVLLCGCTNARAYVRPYVRTYLPRQ